MNTEIRSSSATLSDVVAPLSVNVLRRRVPQRRSRILWGLGTVLLAQLALALASGQAPTTDLPKPAAEGESDKSAATTKSAAEPNWAKNLAEWKALKERETADNSFCNVCHSNYEGEKLVKIHLHVGVGCETCHGISDEHSEDEDNITPPEVMFAKEKVQPFCTSCHSQEDLVHEDEHKDLFNVGVENSKTCTDCHAKQHRLQVRTRRWDKNTGKLQWYDGVRMMQKRDGGK